jgi:glucose/arabinose dehydrogenase
MTKRIDARWLAGLGVLALSCSDDPSNPPDPPVPSDYTYEVVEAFANLTFQRPIDIRNAGDGSDRLFVVEQLGIIRVFANVDTVATTSVFLDLTASVAAPFNSELGLLGLAFHPQYASNGFFYVYYTTGSPGGPTGNRRSRLSRFSVSGDPDAADPASERIMLDFPQRADNHNGGGMCFDGDGYLCLGLGDEGSGGDLYDNAQNTATIYGSILRLDVDQNVNTPPYHGIPADNPFVGVVGSREEIFAYGLRNPWRVSYDAVSDRLWVGDVGQSSWEEIDIIENGANYGWDCREANVAYTGPPDDPSAVCATAMGFTSPVFAYPRSEGASITGGYVYRGPTLTSLTGRYVYADYITGRVWALTTAAPPAAELLEDTGHFIPTLGIAEDGELFFPGYFSNGTPTRLYRITQTEVQP